MDVRHIYVTCMQEEGLDPLGQGLEMVVSHYMGAGH